MEDWSIEDVPCYKITVDVYVTGHNPERAWSHLNAVLSKAASFSRSTMRDDESRIWDWDINDWEEA